MLKIKKFTLLSALLVVIVLFFLNNSRRSRVFIIGIDALDPAMIAELIKEDKLPNIKFLIKNGSYGIHSCLDLNPGDILSPIIWTSIATGVRPENHGITRDYIVNNINSGKVSNFFVSRLDVKKAFIWDIFNAYNKKVAVINWWGTYPTEKTDGFVVSNSMNDSVWLFNQDFLGNDRGRGIGKIARITYPESLYNKLVDYRLNTYRIGNRPEESAMKKIVASVNKDDYIRNEEKRIKFPLGVFVKRVIDFDRNTFIFTKYFLDRYKGLDLVTAYFDGIDAFSHVFWCFRRPDLYPGLQEKHIRAYREIIDDYYALMDSYVGQILRYVRDNDVLIICSDHGFEARNDYLEQLKEGNMKTGDHKPEGCIILYGKKIKKGFSLKDISLLDILPTVLYLNKMPLSLELEGRVLYECFETGVANAVKPKFTKYYTQKIRKDFPEMNTYGEPFKEEMRNRLKSLGYLN